ncbi:TetR/AcrR family transcriptional regulator [Vibrio navarrensis]|uniref:TetR/AcrR family transcriptional regulator n=1 Tax=Vibrio navarrensis TaxID=29495 RepID=UPI001869B418|nr:TetR/AcrR family transcriptional regulator [Vibrio navarrensis]MBE4601115.1 hypothetical protein [Vibrio navarrensis]
MARTKQFDEKDALLTAMKVFWSKGFEATSMADLLVATGLSKSSLYSTFGNKRSLFLAAFEMYRKERMVMLRGYLSSEATAFGSIKSFFEMVLMHAQQEERPFGCMSCNEAVEFGPHDTEILDLIKRDFQGIEDELAFAISQGIEDGSIPRDKEPKKLARFLTVTHQGIQIMARSNTEPERLHDALEVMLSALK